MKYPAIFVVTTTSPSFDEDGEEVIWQRLQKKNYFKKVRIRSLPNGKWRHRRMTHGIDHIGRTWMELRFNLGWKLKAYSVTELKEFYEQYFDIML